MINKLFPQLQSKQSLQIFPNNLSIFSNNKMSSSSSHRHQQQQQSDHSLRVKFQDINKVKQYTPSQSRLIKKPSIHMKLQKSHQYQNQSNLSSLSLEEQQLSSLPNLSSNQPKKKSTQLQPRKSQISNFIVKTYRILQDKSNSQIIHWTDQGNAFIVKNKDLFQNQILPKYFKHKKFSSFVRQLNMYDFHKIRKQKEIPIFKHKYFKQGNVELLSKIKRKSGDEVMMNEYNNNEDEGVQVMGGNINVNNDDGNYNNVLFCDTKNYIPSLFELGQKVPPIMSSISFKSKSMLPYQTSQPSLGLLPHIINGQKSQIQLLIQENTQLNTSISQLTRQQVQLQLQKQRTRQKITKILSILINCQLNNSKDNDKNTKYQQHTKINEQYPLSKLNTIRDLQQHIMSQQQSPYSICQYLSSINRIYHGIKVNLLRMNNNSNSQIQQQHKVNNNNN